MPTAPTQPKEQKINAITLFRINMNFGCFFCYGCCLQFINSFLHFFTKIPLFAIRKKNRHGLKPGSSTQAGNVLLLLLLLFILLLQAM